MAEFTASGNRYQSRKMTAFTQFHVARRLGPIFSSLAQSFRAAKADAQGNIINADEIFEPISVAISSLKDADADYVLNACLAVCQRQNSTIWSDVTVQGSIMFQDIDLQALMQIVWNVLQDNFASFFPGRPGPISGGPSATA